MKTVVGAGVDVRFIGLARGFQCLFIGGPAFVDARIQFTVVQHHWRLDSGDILGFGLATIKGHGSPQFRISHGRRIGDTTAVAEGGSVSDTYRA